MRIYKVYINVETTFDCIGQFTDWMSAYEKAEEFKSLNNGKPAYILQTVYDYGEDD